jgi:predicted amino acid racemase
MFLEALIRRNPEFVVSAARLHQRGLLQANTYVLDYNALTQNIELMKAEADRLRLSVYPMTKQIGRNPIVLDLIKRKKVGRVVAVDWMEALQVAANGGEIGHVGHLVQVPKTETRSVAALNPEVWTVFSQKKAFEISQALAATNRTQQLLLRIWKEGDVFYPGHEGGIHINDVRETAEEIASLAHVKIAGVTSFPCMLFDEVKKELHATPNLDTIMEAYELLSNKGFEVTQVNAPGTTSAAALSLLAQKGATHVEPGHGMTGTTPFHAFEDLPEIPAILYLSEISHVHGGRAYFFGGGLYIDPVFTPYTVRAIAGRDEEDMLNDRYEAVIPDPGSIDYYGMLKIGSGKLESGDTVILCFRPQVFRTRARVAVVQTSESGEIRVLGQWDSSGRELN